MAKDNAFSGLEAAIVLIAFVVVAAVFSYVMLGAGFFATQKSQEVTYSGIKQTTSNLVLDGSLYGSVISGHSQLQTVTFYLQIPQGGQAQQLGNVAYGVTVNGNKYQYVDSASPGNKEIHVLYYTKSSTNPDSDVDSNGVLAAGDKAKMQLSFTSTSTAAFPGPAPGGEFTLEIRPSVGASTLITKDLVTGYSGGPII